MILHDQHVHSYYSFDSDQKIEEYLVEAKRLGLSYFVLTDHCDLNYLDKRNDLFFPIEKQNEELNKFQKDFKEIKLLRGIEIGYKPNQIERIKKILETHTFDLVNFSLHEADGIDYYYPEEFKKRGIEKTLKHYFNKLLEAVESFNDYDVLCHFDYGFKTAYLSDNTFNIGDYKDDITKIMKVVIQNNKALEINIKVHSFLPLEHTKYILNLYRSLGGKYLTLSSDAHKLCNFRHNFEKYIKLIKECGFDSLTYFVNRGKYLLKI